jgi:hypothetical protein
MRLCEGKWGGQEERRARERAAAGWPGGRGRGHLRCAESHGWLLALELLLSLLFDWGGGLTAAAAEAAYPEEKS